MKQESYKAPTFSLQLFLLPGEDAPLNIFEPRYIEMINDAREKKTSFIIPYSKDTDGHGMGCEVEVQQVVAERPDGRMVIMVESRALVRVLRDNLPLEGKLYREAEFVRVEASDPVSNLDLLEAIELYREQYEHDFLSCCMNSSIRLQDVLAALNLNSDDKYHFCSLASLEQKENYLLNQMNYLGMIRKQETLLGNDFGLN